MELKERIDTILELVAIKLDDWGVYFPPPVDDYDPTRRVTWDLFTDGSLYGGKYGFHKYDWSAIDRETGVATEKVELMVTRALITTALTARLPNKDFVFLGGRIWQPNKGFLRCYVEHRYKELKQRIRWWLLARSDWFRERRLD